MPRHATKKPRTKNAAASSSPARARRTARRRTPQRARRSAAQLRASKYYFDHHAAQRAVDFFRLFLVHVHGEWADRPLIPQEWVVRQLIKPLFGWKRCADKLRRYRTVFVAVPRKNAKSTIAAAIALYLLVMDREPGAQIVSGAKDREQAGFVFEPARQMAQKSSHLSTILEVFKRAIVYPATGSAYKVISADVKNKHGGNLHGVIFDEFHAQSTWGLWDALRTGSGSRRQPVRLLITTAGDEETSPCAEEWDYARNVRDGVFEDETYLPIIYEAGKEEDWKDEKVWARVNPGLGVTKKWDDIREEFRRALTSLPHQNAFRRLHLNQWTEQAERWLDLEDWQQGAAALDLPALKGRRCFAGLDLSSTQDMTAFVLAFPPENDGDSWVVLPWFWVPEVTAVKRAEKDRRQYGLWIQQGWLAGTPGNVVDQAFIYDTIVRLGEEYDLQEIAYDPWNAAGIVTRLMDAGMTMVPFRQGFASFTAPCREFERLILSGKIRHGGNPILRWQAGNVTVVMDAAGNMKPKKTKSTKKIDGIVALIMALGRAIVAPKPEPSVYEERGLIIL